VHFRLDSTALADLVAKAQESGSLRRHLTEHQTSKNRLREILELYSTGQLTFDEYRAAKTAARLV
jgi:site-specific DNA recombinase